MALADCEATAWDFREGEFVPWDQVMCILYVRYDVQCRVIDASYHACSG